MYVNQATFALFESYLIRANICMFIAAKLSQIALFTYICSLVYYENFVVTVFYFRDIRGVFAARREPGRW